MAVDGLVLCVFRSSAMEFTVDHERPHVFDEDNFQILAQLNLLVDQTLIRQ